MALNARQQLFAEEYAANPNATKAAIAAGYSARSAGQIGERLLKNDEIASAVEKAKAERLKRIGVNGDRVLEELARLAFLDVRKLFNSDGTMKCLDEIDADVAAAIAGLEVVALNNGDGEQVGTPKRPDAPRPDVPGAISFRRALAKILAARSTIFRLPPCGWSEDSHVRL